MNMMLSYMEEIKNLSIYLFSMASFHYISPRCIIVLNDLSLRVIKFLSWRVINDLPWRVIIDLIRLAAMILAYYKITFSLIIY